MSPEENQTFKPIPNPYFAGPPIRGQEVFFGREENFEAVSQRLTAERDGIVMLLVGGRRTGKTSIMYQILEGRLGDKFLPIFLDLQSIAPLVGDREILGRLADLILEGIKDERLVRDYYDFDEGNPVIVFDRLLDDIQQLFPKKRIIFLVDEAEHLQTKVAHGELTAGVLTYLASILESRKISFCFTGSPGLSEIQGEEWRRLMAKGDYSEITFLSPDDTKRLIQKPVEGSVFYADGVVDTIYNLTYGQPFFTQIICTNVVDYLNGVQRNELQLEDLEEVVRTIVDNPPPQLIYDWDNLSRQKQLTMSLLSSASSGPGDAITAEQLADSIRENDYPLTLRADAIHIALESLFNHQWVERDEEGAYYICVDLFRQWIRRARSIWRLVEDQEPPGKKKLWAAAGAIAAVLVAAVAAVLWLSQGSEIEQIQQQNAEVAPPTVGSIYLQSEPVEVEVWLDGQLINKTTPVKIDSLEPITLDLKSEPAGADIFVDGSEVPVGQTPYRLELERGRHQVRLELFGYDTESIDRNFAPGEKDELSFTLKAQYGKIRIAWPYSGMVEINGMDHSIPPLDIEKPVGTYKMVLKGKTDTLTVDVMEGEMKIVRLP